MLNKPTHTEIKPIRKIKIQKAIPKIKKKVRIPIDSMMYALFSAAKLNNIAV
jgi:hypothetical protein